MSNSPLQLARKWKTLLADAETAIESEDFATAEATLKEALEVMDTLEREGSTAKGGAEDLRVAETLERLGFVYQNLNRNLDAEHAYRRALKITKGRLLAFSTTDRCSAGLIALLETKGDHEGADKLREEYPQDEIPLNEDEQERLADKFDLLENRLLGSLVHYTYTPETCAKVLPILEDLAAHFEATFGSDNADTIGAISKLGSAYLESDKEKAVQHVGRALKKALSSEKIASSDLADCMMQMSKCVPGTPLSRALTAKAKSYSGFQTPLTLAESIMAKIAEAQGVKLPPDMPLEEADKVIEEWSQAQVEPDTPFVSMSVTEAQRYKQLQSMIESTLSIVRDEEKEDPTPLSTISLMSYLSQVNEQLGDNANAMLWKRREMEIIGKHWGEGHVMMLEALEELERLEGAAESR